MRSSSVATSGRTDGSSSATSPRGRAELTIARRAIEFDKADFRLSETKPFSWRRNLPPLEAKKSVFNYVATDNDYERRFAEFLDKKASDMLRFASLGTTRAEKSADSSGRSGLARPA